MKILSVASEVFPLVKTGGLADVAGALPLALSSLGLDVRTLMPGYQQVMSGIVAATPAHSFPDLFGGPARLLSAKHNGLDLFILDAPHLYDRPGNIYIGPDKIDWSDNSFRFAALAWVGAWLGRGCLPGYQPDVVHAHDWQAGLTPAYLRFAGEGRTARSMITIHNIAYQGRFSASIFPYLGLPDQAFAADAVEYYGDVSYLKAGLALADTITTVSPSYAREITTAPFGMGLDGLLRHRARSLHGILNGIDTSVWNPATDPYLRHRFNLRNMRGRNACRAELEALFELRGEGPILTVISRLTSQKGLDVLVDSLDSIVAMGCRLVVLGSGDQPLEQRLQDVASRHPGRAGVKLGYDEPLAHIIQAGGDAIVVPSRFEPCGLTQLCALRYGSVPIVSRVGGLNDTIIDANEAALLAEVATGFQFPEVNQLEILHAIRRMLAIYAFPESWAKLVRRGMKSDVSWNRSAEHYVALYQSLLLPGGPS